MVMHPATAEDLRCATLQIRATRLAAGGPQVAGHGSLYRDLARWVRRSS